MCFVYDGVELTLPIVSIATILTQEAIKDTPGKWFSGSDWVNKVKIGLVCPADYFIHCCTQDTYPCQAAASYTLTHLRFWITTASVFSHLTAIRFRSDQHSDLCKYAAEICRLRKKISAKRRSLNPLNPKAFDGLKLGECRQTSFSNM